MTEKQKDDIYYVCCLIEFIARKTKNHRQDVIQYFTKKDLERQLRLAEVNHCLSFEQVSEKDNWRKLLIVSYLLMREMILLRLKSLPEKFRKQIIIM